MYLIRVEKAGGWRYVLTAGFYARRQYKTEKVRDLGWATEVRETEKVDKRWLRLHFGGKRRGNETWPDTGPAYYATGQEHGAESVYVETTAAGVKQRIRKVRPEEQAEIDGAMANLRRAEEQVAAARAHLEETVKNAWGKAHVVRLNEVQAAILERDEK